MNFLFLINFFCIVIILISCFFLILSKNPVYSVFFLILVFLSSSIILIAFQIDFLGLLLLIIYVGAIAVLFLFVVMMLDLKSQHVFSFNIADVLVYLFIIFGMFSYFYNLKLFSFLNKEFSLNSYFFLLDSFNNVDIFGQCFYNYFSLIVIIIGIILLVAMLGAILLTLRFNIYNKKAQFAYRQLSRSDSFLSFFS